MAESDCPETEGASKNNAQPASDGAEAAKRRAGVGGASSFDCLPEEIALAIARALGDDPASLIRWALTCRRHYLLAMDTAVWRGMCETRFGPPLHQRFLDEGKDWRWLYQSQACAAGAESTGVYVGATAIDLDWYRRIYWGDLIDGKPDGYGLSLAIARYGGSRAPTRLQEDDAAEPPSRYEGHWKEGKRHGYGIDVTRGGGTYDGQWQADNYHGHGTYTWSIGTTYHGSWVDNRQQGYGSFADTDGSWYDGQWENGLPHGYGHGTTNQGYIYRGLFRHGKRHGYGVALADGLVAYEGQWADNGAHGYGTGRDSHGNVYCGWWADGTMCGYGVQRSADGVEYTGMFQDGQRPDGGDGAQLQSDGTQTVASESAREVAQMVITRPDGFRYEGGWNAFGSAGHGTCVYPDGSCVVGTWNGEVPLDGEITSHGVSATPCDISAPCVACKVMARRP
ncbi:Morn repeat domain containing protein [Pandoravirus salinus]|uniref:Morn repeat domain containing protein n=1 Tax=Pandoravirus salinus TaxID=1349410 RepID=S4VXL9_9VIRU|nr:morn repeat domain [Pandoravirus salinus]AGO85414.1 Morn repeat domain containing protein [Pandoravirus salinus]